MMLLFVLVICVLMLNLVSTNCCAMLYTLRKAIHLQGIEHRIVKNNHPRISTGNTYILINPTHFLSSSTGH
jgi:hypothetical protein